jgi:hypothetical protein
VLLLLGERVGMLTAVRVHLALLSLLTWMRLDCSDCRLHMKVLLESSSTNPSPGERDAFGRVSPRPAPSSQPARPLI